MTTNRNDIFSLKFIDEQCALPLLQQEGLSFAQYELVRQVIQQTGDWEYQSLLCCEAKTLEMGGAALATRIPVIVDVLMVQAGILTLLEKTFVNPVYCAESLYSRRHKDKSPTAVSMEMLAQRYPEAIFILGQDQESLLTLLDLIEVNGVQPALVIATIPDILDDNLVKNRLQSSLVPQISLVGTKGNAVVAVTIFNTLVDLAWQIYEQNDNNLIALSI